MTNGKRMTNQFTDEQIEAACVAYEYINYLITALRERAVSDSPAHTLMREAADTLMREAADALEAAAGVAPQAPSERESDKECPHTPRDEWRRRGYCHRCTVEAGWTLLSDQEARRELPVQPSSTVDEGKLADEMERHRHVMVAPGPHQCSCSFVMSEDPGFSGWAREHKLHVARAIIEAIGGEKS